MSNFVTTNRMYWTHRQKLEKKLFANFKNVPIQDEEVMVSFDVQSLFIRVPIEGAIKLLNLD